MRCSRVITMGPERLVILSAVSGSVKRPSGSRSSWPLPGRGRTSPTIPPRACTAAAIISAAVALEVSAMVPMIQAPTVIPPKVAIW